MYLAQVKIESFRLFESLEVNLNRGVNVLVGENDSGKTALVDAIRYVLGTNSNDRSYIAEQDFFEDAAKLTIQLKFSEIDDHAHRFVEHLSYEEYQNDAGRSHRSSVLFLQLTAEKTDIERRGYPYIKTELRSGLNGNGLPIEGEIRSFLAATYLKPLRDAAAELSSGRASRLSQILSSSKSVREGVDTILSIISAANQELLKDDAPLKKAAENIQTNYLQELLFDADKDHLGAFIDIGGVGTVDVNDVPDNKKRRHLRSVLEGLSLSLTKDRRLHGLGYHNLLFMAAEMLLLEQEADKDFPLLLIEEPEAHLHPQLQMKLLQFVNDKAKSDKQKDGIQCILTTHSPNISSKVDPSEVIMLAGGKAWSLREGETELESEDSRYLSKFLDATKANVFFAKSLLLVEGDSENIFLPVLAKLLGRPLEDYGVSIIKYDNSGSWKRFARLFLRRGQDENKEGHHPTKVCVLRDLDLWPDCAEELEDDANRFGFKRPNDRNQRYWLRNCDDVAQRKVEHADGLSRQNVSVVISDDWTFEFCLARHGLFEECYEVINGDLSADILAQSNADEKATYILSKVQKTDFAYDLSEILERKLEEKINAAVAALDEADQQNPIEVAAAVEKAKSLFALELRDKLPRYIVRAIEYVTLPICEDAPLEGGGDVRSS